MFQSLEWIKEGVFLRIKKGISPADVFPGDWLDSLGKVGCHLFIHCCSWAPIGDQRQPFELLRFLETGQATLRKVLETEDCISYYTPLSHFSWNYHSMSPFLFYLFNQHGLDWGVFFACANATTCTKWDWGGLRRVYHCIRTVGNVRIRNDIRLLQFSLFRDVIKYLDGFLACTDL